MENPFKKSVKNEEISDENVSGDSNIESSENCDENNIDTSAEQQSDSDSKDAKTENEDNELQKKYDELNNQYLRLAADFDNFRKRTAQERETLLKYGAESTLKKLLEVLDNFERGLKAIETVEDCEKVKECYNLAYKNFTDVLTKAGLETIKSEGEAFDPNFHEAVMQTPTSEKEENTIIAELQKGYKLGDRVLRPALVNVATPE